MDTSLLLLFVDKILVYFLKICFLLSRFGGKNYNKLYLVCSMRCFFRECDFVVGGNRGSLDITDEVLNYVAEARIGNGHLLIQPLDGDCSVCFNDCFSGGSLSLVIFGGVLRLGETQKILFCHFGDVGGVRRCVVSIIGA